MVKWYTPPKEQGQIVQVSYALTPCGVIEAIHDRSDRSTSYYLAKWTQRLEKWSDNSGPWNTPPPKARWKKIRSSEMKKCAGSGLDGLEKICKTKRCR